MNRMLRLDWHIIAGIAAAVIALVLHLLHMVESDVLLTLALVLLALLLIRDLHRESADERLGDTMQQTHAAVEEVRRSLEPPETILIGPSRLRSESRRFSQTAQGEMIWFNVCFLMFKSQEVFDLMLRPAVENPAVDAIQFVADEAEKSHWDQYMAPKIKQCTGSDKVKDPRWRTLPQTVSFILTETSSSGATEALLSFWGEPFMARVTGVQAPRYIFRVQPHSDLISRLVELDREHRREV